MLKACSLTELFRLPFSDFYNRKSSERHPNGLTFLPAVEACQSTAFDRLLLAFVKADIVRKTERVSHSRQIMPAASQSLGKWSE